MNKINNYLILFLLFLIFLINISPLQVFSLSESDNDINDITKTAYFNEDESEVIIDIQTQYQKKNIKTLVFQGTYCTAHGLSNDTLVNMLQTLVNNGDIDYYADATHYSSGTRVKQDIKQFKKGDVITLSDIYKTSSTRGTHIVSQRSLDDLMNLLQTGEYDYLVMILDGSFSTGLSAGSNSDIFNVKKSLVLTDQEYVDRMEYAKILSDMPILYLMSPLEGNDVKIDWDTNSGTSYTSVRGYWADSNYDGKYSSDKKSLNYLNAHLFVEGLAFLAPEYYLTLIDSTTGKPNISVPPTASEIEYKYDNFVSYNDSKNVINKLKTSSEYFLPITTTIKDTLADGLSYLSSKVQYYDDLSLKWEDLSTNDKVNIETKINGQTITKTITDEESIYNGKKLRLVIDTLPSEDFGSDGNPVNTNEECEVVYKNDEGKTLVEQSDESPSVQFSMINVYYEEGDNGTLTGIASELFKKNNKNITSGSSVEANTNYNHIGWICDKDVNLEDGTYISKGEILTDEQIGNVIATDNLTFVAQYEPIKYKVNYVVEEDDDWGSPDESIIPIDNNSYVYNDTVKVISQDESLKGYAVDSENGKKVPGTWKFKLDEENNPELNEENEFKITENTEVKGSWTFAPDSVKLKYNVIKDEVWGEPTDSEVKSSETEHEYKEKVKVSGSIAPYKGTALDKELEKEVSGTWEFKLDEESNPKLNEENEFKITENTEVKGSWIFVPDKLHVEYITKDDEVWGKPLEDIIPMDYNLYDYKDNFNIINKERVFEGTATDLKTGKKVSGKWELVVDKSDIIITENKIINAQWKFTPNTVDNPATGDNLYIYILLFCFSLIALITMGISIYKSRFK